MKTLISVNWNNPFSIQKAERKKRRLENQGYNLEKTQNFNQISILTYSKP